MKRGSITLAGGIVWLAQSLSSQSVAPEKTAGEVMKNVQVLKDIPISQWDDAMNFMSGALGVRCQHCHVSAFEKDDQKSKQTARLMIKMTREINAANFGGQIVVTCNTCHQGSLRPKAMPGLWTKKPAIAVSPAPANTEPLPVDQVMAKYRKAVGPEVRSLRMKGTIDTSQGSVSVDIDMSMPDKLAVHASVAGAEFQQVFSGDSGWLSGRGTITEMTPANIVAGKLILDTMRPVKFGSVSAPRTVTGTEMLGDRTCIVVASRSAKRLERLYFDTQSGLLSKRYAEIQTPFGPVPNETTFEDYRDADGVMLPRLIRVHSMSDLAEYKFSEIQINLAIDPARFEKPSLGPGR